MKEKVKDSKKAKVVNANSPKLKQIGSSNYVFDMVDALNAPIITFSQQWANVIPKRMLEIVRPARLKALILRENLATYPESVIYIYTRSLEAPMDQEWVDIYTHVSCKTLEDWFGEDRWNDINAPKKLNPWLQSKLDRLKQFIYHKRREIVKQRLKEMERKVA